MRVSILFFGVNIQCAPRFRYLDKNVSSVQLLVNKKCFALIKLLVKKTSFISPASI